MRAIDKSCMRNVLLFACGALSWTGPIYAQGTPQGSSEARDNEIIVTAQRREEALEDVPVSITAISNESLAKAGIVRLEDISQVSAGTVISRTGIFLQPAIRGVTTAQAAFAENNIAVYVDGFYRPSTRGLNTELANLKQVTVLKGPQGTLFGRNATGGAILIETLDPSMYETSGRVMAGFGNFDDKQLQGYVSAPIGDKIAFSFSGSYHESDGYLYDSFLKENSAPQDLNSFLVKLRLQPNENLDLIFAAESSKVSDARGLASTCVSFCLATVAFGDTNVENRPYRTSFTFVPTNITHDKSISLTARYDLGFAKLNSYTFYQNEKSRINFDIDMAPRAILAAPNKERWRTFTQEVNLTSASGSALQYTVGLYYFRTKQNSPSFSQVLSGTTVIPNTTGNIDTEAWAAYADATLQIGEKLYLTAGGRYSDETKRAVYFPVDVGFVRTELDPLKSSNFTPRFVARYALTDRSNVYASFSRGTKSGLYNASFPFTPVKDEKITAYEIGYKTNEGPIRFDASAYYYDYKNLQVSAVIIRNNAQATITTNAATAEIYGAETQFSAQVTDQFNIRVNAAYTHARYKKYPNATVNVIQNGLNSSSCPNPNAPPATIPCQQDWSGLRMMRAPDWSANMTADYSIPMSNGGEINLSGNLSYESFRLPTKSDIDLDGKGYRYGQKGTLLVNLQASWQPSDGPWTFTAYGTNVTDVKYKIVAAGAQFGNSVLLGPPRMYGIKAEYTF
jgi:iron complex outermembrane receptor protein